MLRFPDLAGELDGQYALLDDALTPHVPNPVAALCECLEGLHADGTLVLVEDHECHPTHVAYVASRWKDAGMIGRPTNETIAAVLAAERLPVPLVCADVSVRRLAQTCGVRTVSVDDFDAAVAA